MTAPATWLGPDDKSYIISASNSGVLAKWASPEGLPDYLVTLDFGAVAGSGHPRWGGHATLSYLKAGLDVSAGGFAYDYGIRTFGLRYDLDPDHRRAALIGAVQDAFRAERHSVKSVDVALVRRLRGALGALNRSFRLVASTDYADAESAGNAWSAGVAISKLERLGLPGALRFSVTPVFIHYHRAPDTTDAATATVLVAYEDRYPTVSDEAAFLHWRTQVGAHYTPRYALANAAVAGVFVKVLLGPNLKSDDTAARNWRAFVSSSTIVTLGAGVGVDRRAYYGLNLSRSFP